MRGLALLRSIDLTGAGNRGSLTAMANPYEPPRPEARSVAKAKKHTLFETACMYAISTLAFATLLLLLINETAPGRPFDRVVLLVSLAPAMVWPRWYTVAIAALGIANWFDAV